MAANWQGGGRRPSKGAALKEAAFVRRQHATGSDKSSRYPHAVCLAAQLSRGQELLARGYVSPLSQPHWRTPMKNFLLSGAAAAFALTSGLAVISASAQTATGFYVVRDATTKKCTIVDQKPTSTTTTVVGDSVYKSRTEAETGMKSIKVCTEQ